MAQYFMPSRENVMNQTETRTLLSLKEEFIQHVEPITLLSNLFRDGYVSKSFYKSVQLLFKNGSKKEEIISYVIDSLPFQVGFPALVITLDKCSYYKLAARLFLKLFEINSDFRMHNAGTVSRTKVQSFFRNLKRLVHDSQFKNPRHTLRNMAMRCKAELDSETDEKKQQLLADRCVAVIGVEIDSFYDSLACEHEITQEEMFLEMRSLIPRTSNPLITDTVYYTRQANMNAFHGNLDHAGNMLIQARTSAFNIEHCIELVNMLYVEVYVKLWEFEMNPSKAVVESLMMWGRIGLESLESESEATKLTWRRMFILRMVFALLGIGNRANIIPRYTVDSASLHEARTLLAVIDTNWNGIEVRREMFYCVARARLKEQLSRFEEAKCFIDRAKLLAVQGRFLEKIPFIDDFARLLNEKICVSSLSLSTDINQKPFVTAETPFQNQDITTNKDNQQQALQNKDIVFKRDQTSEDNVVSHNIEINHSHIKYNCLPKYRCVESNLLQNEDELSGFTRQSQTTQRVTNDLSNENIFSRPNNQTAINYNICEMEALKCCTSESSYHEPTVCKESVSEVHNDVRHIEDLNSAQSLQENEGFALHFEELKMSGGTLVLCSNNPTTPNTSLHTDNVSENSNTKIKMLARTMDSSYCLQSTQSDRNQKPGSNLRRHLLCQCHQGVDFGSVALFEERSEGEGSSNVQLPHVILPDVKQALIDTNHLNSDGSSNLRPSENQLASDIDDEALFGDGISSS